MAEAMVDKSACSCSGPSFLDRLVFRDEDEEDVEFDLLFLLFCDAQIVGEGIGQKS